MPSYYDMAKAAILALKDRTGSSLPAIKAYITANYPSVKFLPHALRAALKKAVEAGKLIKVKASYKLSADEKKPKKVAKKKVVKKKAPKKPKKKVVKKKAPKKKAPKKKAASKKKAAPKKKAATKKKTGAKKVAKKVAKK
uniref:H15 domain-containing protein n=1 Tax=Fibrocapsa japonica TaxID=94617 RepID=A0A7S2Y1F8_9STRA|mmetsp:Transcript_21692/g.31479  ORF Transcript_21692/g.31479 Transcript_21692/m.31479 type:complete len:140 (+) Transcript_21692:77-496(+)|eukprot:CAMPEP_0113943818 /NCGR_PEP_ID=MMETSP1339-20121228/28190_1 /TAXON_ID=94617 /ORGANISM="Fibrocapsa japonica" /LENGTH=139 /DNA_ID=CAMNT_0000948781 /DNA_START=57 /DNA_END=476 /DNA_ORIENTATION=- /assembly_acc=CAM_ASM_000762